MKMDPTGKYLAIATGPGVQLYHFNGAKPITSFTGVIGTSGSISQIAWDTSGHLYALNTSGKVHVYTVTSTSVKEVAGSPYVIPNGTQATALIVRSN
jgi:small-conductance mechanosensitive channel